MASVLGWDLGGANLKLARIEAGRVERVAQIPCPIRQDASKFDAARRGGAQPLPAACTHAVTMTGELSDVFANRAEGVAYLVDMMRNGPAAQALVLCRRKSGFLDCRRRGRAGVRRGVGQLACERRAGCPNAARRVVDRRRHDHDGPGSAQGRSRGGAGLPDGERLAESELVYTGVVRTPVMAVARTAPFKGRMQRIAAERFATMADVWRLIGDLPDDADPYPAPDLRGQERRRSAARLARMLGRDANEAGLRAFADLARHFADCQLAEIEEAARTLLAREALAPDAPVIGAGCGRFIARQLAERLGRPYCDFAELIDCAPDARDMAATLRASGRRRAARRTRIARLRVKAKRGERLKRSPPGAN